MYCTHCGKPLPPGGVCPNCAKKNTLPTVHPLGQTVYAFSEGPAFLLLCLIWSLSTLWTDVLLLRSAPVGVLLMLPFALVCAGLWITYASMHPHNKRVGLNLAANSMLAALTVTTLVLTAMSLVSFYGIFLCTTDRESYTTLFSYFKLMGALFVTLFFSMIYLNQLRKILRTAYGVLRGNRGMAICPISVLILTLAFAAAAMVTAFSTRQLTTCVSLLRHTLNRLPSVLHPVANAAASLGWDWIPLSLIGISLALLTTFVILILYRVQLQRTKRSILRGNTAPQQPEQTQPSAPAPEPAVAEIAEDATDIL